MQLRNNNQQKVDHFLLTALLEVLYSSYTTANIFYLLIIYYRS